MLANNNHVFFLQILKPISGYYDHAISMTPDYHKAVSDTIEFYGWKSVIYMYESLDGTYYVLNCNIFAWNSSVIEW